MSSTTLSLITLRNGLSLCLGLMALPSLSGQQTRGSSCLWLSPPHPFTRTGYRNLKEHLASFCRCSETTKNIIEEDFKILAWAMTKVHQIKNWNQTPNLLRSKGNNEKETTHPTAPLSLLLLIPLLIGEPVFLSIHHGRETFRDSSGLFWAPSTSRLRLKCPALWTE